MEGITLFQGSTLAIALLGAVLGVINTWRGLDQSRVKLRVVPAHAIPVGAVDPSIDFCIEVTNLSAFPVTLREIGLLFRGAEERAVFTINPLLLDGGPWPRRLEPRSSVTVYGHKPDARFAQHVRCAYAKTECGVTETGTSGALRQIAAGR
jgi:hypothetical protein